MREGSPLKNHTWEQGEATLMITQSLWS